MTTKVSKRIAASLHAAVDEIIAANPEAATALEIIFSNVTQAKGAVSVAARKGAASSKKKVVNEVEDDDDDAELLDGDDEGEDDDELEDDEDEEEVKPKRGAKAKAKSDANELDDDDDDAEEGEGDDDADVELPELDTLDGDAILTFMNEVRAAEPEIHDRANITGVKELAAEIDRFGFDTAGLMKGDLATKRASLKSFLSSIYYTVDAVTEFEIDGVIAAVAELDDEFVSKGKGRAKELAAAEALVIAVVAAS